MKSEADGRRETGRAFRQGPVRQRRRRFRHRRDGRFVAKAQHVGEIARILYAENEIVGRRVMPCTPTRCALQGVMRAVDFNALHPARRKFEFARLREFLRIEDTAPARVPPARDADSHAACHDPGSYALSCGSCAFVQTGQLPSRIWKQSLMISSLQEFVPSLYEPCTLQRRKRVSRRPCVSRT